MDKTQPYVPEVQRALQITYIIALVLWLLIVLYFDLIDDNIVVLLILLIPVIVYVFSCYNLSTITVETEEKLFAVSYLSIGLLVIMPLLIWTHDTYGRDHRVMQAIVLGVIFAIVSLIDVWVAMNWISYVRHLRSMFQIASLTLIIYGVYHLFLGNKMGQKILADSDAGTKEKTRAIFG